MKRQNIPKSVSSGLFAVGLSLMLAGATLLPLPKSLSVTDGLLFFILGVAIAVISFIAREGTPDQRLMEKLEALEKKIDALSNKIKSLKP